MSRIRQAIKRHLDNMPNYTCLQTVERYQKFPGAEQESLIDVLRLEVGYVAGKEIFGWPGSSQFEDSELRSLVTTGAFSTGEFTLHARSIFLGDGTMFRGGGEVDLEGQRVLRFDYVTPNLRSGYELRNPKKNIGAVVAYHGSIWARKDNFELLRISIETDDIPPEIEIRNASNLMEYQTLKIGSTDALLPLRSVIRLIDDTGRLAINRTRLSRCKQYSGESTLSFEDVSDSTASGPKASRELVFEPYTEIELALEQEIAHGEHAVGDAIKATLRRDIKVGKKVLAEKGSIAKGRILRLEHYAPGNESIFNVTLQFDELIGADWNSSLRLRLVRAESPAGPPPGATVQDKVVREYTVLDTDTNGFLVYRKHLKLPRGFTTIWQTQK
ncbi:MAG: hypothetical protein FJW36_05135 [Acidobacteria bacterium]|nr:hypothetical protein [Acidobacteriota bacterium]